MNDLINWLFSTEYWPPRWYCGLWTEGLGWTHIISDTLIFGAYMAIPLILIYFIVKRRDFIPFRKIFIYFALFIVFCGMTHLISAIIFYYPVYRFDALVKAGTALVSWMTVFALIPEVPNFLRLPKMEQMNELLKKDLSEEREKLKIAVEDLEHSNHKLEKSNKMLEEFSYLSAHDLKQPIRGMKIYSDILLEDHGSQYDEDTKTKLGKISKLGEHSLHLIDTLLEYSRVTYVDLARKQVDLGKVIQRIKESMENELDTHNINLRILDKFPIIECDEARIGEVFRNLISNAIKYNDKQEKKIEIGCQESETGNLFFVKDNGIGIAENNMVRVFKMFQRADTDGKYEGMGVGLAVVQTIIERHDGAIWVESKPGEGSAFYFTIGHIPPRYEKWKQRYEQVKN